MPFPPSIIFEFICLLAGLWWLLRAHTGWWRWFVAFILYTLLTEVAGYLIINHGLSAYWLYNIYLYFKFLFTVFLFTKLIPSYSSIWRIIGLVIFHGILFYEIADQGFLKYASTANIFCGAWVIIWCCNYFLLLMKDKSYINIKWHAPFWIFTGLLFFYLGTTTASIFFKQLAYINKHYQIPLRFIIFNVLSLILYANWSYAFLCKFRQKISSPT